MKRKTIRLIIFASLIAVLAGIQPPVKVESSGCSETITHKHDRDYYDSPGAKILRAVKEEPVNAFVVGQDPAEWGVNLIVEIQSRDLEFTHNRPVSICAGSYYEQEGVEQCDPGEAATRRPYYPFYYEEQACDSDPVTLQRPILADSLKVWLSPVEESNTNDWLGESATGGKNPLRYVFPEKWSLGTWIPGGYISVEGGGLWAEYQIEDFAEENPGFNFLKADPRETSYLSMRLPFIYPPGEATGQGTNTWGLFGEFGVRQGLSTPGGACLFDISGKWDDPGCRLIKTYSTRNPGEVTGISLALNHVPVDLPGQWQINVWFQTGYASLRSGAVPEPAIDPKNLTVFADENYFRDGMNIFNVLIWMTTPCNPNEKEGCTSNTSSPP